MNTTANLISVTPAVFLKVVQVFHNVSCATYMSGKFSQYTLPAFKRKAAVFYVFTHLYLYVLMLLILIHIKKQGNVYPVSRCFSQSYTSFFTFILVQRICLASWCNTLCRYSREKQRVFYFGFLRIYACMLLILIHNKNITLVVVSPAASLKVVQVFA